MTSLRHGRGRDPGRPGRREGGPVAGLTPPDALAAPASGVDPATGRAPAATAQSGGSPAPDPARPRVAFQGALGAFSEEAVEAFFGPDAVPLPCREFRDLGAAVTAGEADFGMLPIENSLAGSVLPAYDVLVASDLVIHGEVIRPIRLCLLGVPGARIETLRRVLSHPVALGQCTRFLQVHPGLEAMAVYDTAGAARDVAEKGDRAVAAVAARGAAERYGLDVLQEGLQDRDDNQTRFLVVARPGTPPPAGPARRGPPKTFVILETENRPGALVEVLLPFASRGVNLLKLESRPGGEPWTYRFFLDLEADAAEEPAATALAEVGGRARSLRVVGSFPSWAEP